MMIRRMLAIAVLLTGLSASPATSAEPTVDPNLASEATLYEVVRHLYRWYLDEDDAHHAAAIKIWDFRVRNLTPDLDPGDKSRYGEIHLPQLDITVRVKHADYTIEEMNTVVQGKRYKIVGVAREVTDAATLSACKLVSVEAEALRAYLFQTRAALEFPDAALLLRLQTAARKLIAKELEGREGPRPEGSQAIHVSSLSPVANELWVFWENGRLLIRFASDIDLANPAVWEHEELAAKLFNLDTHVVVSLDDVAGSNAFLTRDQVGRALFNCIVLGQRTVVEPLPQQPAAEAPAAGAVPPVPPAVPVAEAPAPVPAPLPEAGPEAAVAPPVAATATRGVLGATWLVEDIAGHGVIDNAQTTLGFEDGSVSGSTGCNRYTGQATLDGNRVTFGPLACTRRACAPALNDQEQRFLAALDQVRAFTLDERDVLVLLDVAGKHQLRLTRMDTP